MGECNYWLGYFTCNEASKEYLLELEPHKCMVKHSNCESFFWLKNLIRSSIWLDYRSEGAAYWKNIAFEIANEIARKIPNKKLMKSVKSNFMILMHQLYQRTTLPRVHYRTSIHAGIHSSLFDIRTPMCRDRANICPSVESLTILGKATVGADFVVLLWPMSDSHHGGFDY